MRLIKMLIFLALIPSAFLLAGCGENSNTNGSFTLTVASTAASGSALMTATVTVSPGRAGSLTGIPVIFTAVQSGVLSGTIVNDPVVGPVELKTDISGTAKWQYSFIQKSYDTKILVTAKVEGIESTEAVTVAKY